MKKVDAVFTWVDGTDEEWIQKKNKVLSSYSLFSTKNGLVKGRFINRDEIKFSLRSLETYLPWINHIFIITDKQTPSWLSLNTNKITIVDHEKILPSFVKKPVFNSLLIECFLHKIPKLNDQFIYFNDDFMIGKPLNYSDFFNFDNKPIYYISETFPFKENKLLKNFKSKNFELINNYFINRSIPQPFYQNSFDLFKIFHDEFNFQFYLKHTPKACLKSSFVFTYNKYLSFIKNMSQNQFRGKNDIFILQLIVLEELIKGKCDFSHKENDLLEILFDKDNFISEKIINLWSNDYKFLSIADGEKTANKEIITIIFDFLTGKFNKSCSFEKKQIISLKNEFMGNFYKNYISKN